MVDVSIVNETSPEANWNRRTDGQTDRQTNLRPRIFYVYCFYMSKLLITHLGIKFKGKASGVG